MRLTDDESDGSIGRRTVLKTSGVVAAALAGCTQSQSSAGPSDRTTSGETQSEGTVTGTVGLSHDGAGGTGTESVSATDPSFVYEQPVELNSDVSFRIENTASGDAVQARIDYDTSVETTRTIFNIYDARGALGKGPTEARFFTPDRELKTIGVSLDGDESTFTSHERATYEATMRRGDTAIGSTTFDLIIGHEKQFEYSIEDGVIRFGFNAGKLSTDGELRAVVKTSEDRLHVDSVTYNSDTHRFVSTISADQVPSGEHIARLRVIHPDDGYNELSCAGRIEVP